MTIPTIFRNFKITLRRAGVLLALTLVLTFIAIHAERLGQAAPQSLTLADRIAYQRAIEAVYHRHRLWPKDNPQPKPALSEVLPEAVLRAKVEDALRQSNALAVYWQQPITPEQLQAEIERMARDTKQPEVLRELFAALGNDPYVIAECLARPLLAERWSREQYAADERLHGALQQRAALELEQVGSARQMPRTSGTYREVEWQAEDSEPARLRPGVEINGVLRLDAVHWQEQVQRLRENFGADKIATELPVARWSGLREDAEKFYAVAVLEKSAKRMKVVYVVWQKTPFDAWWKDGQPTLSLEVQASGFGFQLPQMAAVLEQCEGEIWMATSTSSNPNTRNGHAAVWTGNEMIVWGGTNGFSGLNTGGRYNPATDTWTSTSTTNAPSGRSIVTAVWTGNEMIVWGGSIGNSYFNTGGRYNPTANSWQSVTTSSAPSARAFHTAIWTGSEMIIWGGGTAVFTQFGNGGRYNPETNSWRSTSDTGRPFPRMWHTAIWTGTEMIVWGGWFAGSIEDGGRYDPSNNTWVATSSTDAPSKRYSHTAVWTGSRMIIWGGYGSPDLGTGGQYDPSTNSWTATIATGTPSPRSNHTAVWTGSEMITWGGVAGISPNTTQFNSGGRYNPITNTWTATSATNAPSARESQTAVWTGNEMIVWGGLSGSSTRLDTGGRYSFAAALTISPTSQSFPASGGNGTVSVTASNSCTWTATSNVTWLTTTSSGSGNGTVNFTVTPNPSTSSRTGTLTIGTQTFTVKQAGAAPIAVSLSTALTGVMGANLAVPIMVEDLTGKGVTAYDFTLTFDPNVLQLQGTPVDKDGTLSSGFTVTPNATPGQLRVSAFGTTALAGAGMLLKLNFMVTGQPGSSTLLTWQSFRFNEGTPAATTTNGSFSVSGNLPPTLTSLNPNTRTAGDTGFTLTVNGTGYVNGAVVRWNGNDRPTTLVNNTQVTAAIPASDLANAGTINVTAVNPGSAASNALPFTITCSYAIAPTSMSISSASNMGTVSVTTGVNCPWTATSNANWIKVTSGAIGTGNGTVSYAVAANPGAARTGTITIAGQTFTVNQAANVCSGLTITLAPTSLPDGTGGTAYNQTLTASGGTAPYSFAVSAGALPGGLTLASGGVLSGTPNVAGIINFTVTATDANGCTGTHTYRVNITALPGPTAGLLYVLKDSASGNQIYGYAVNETTGALTPLPGFPLSTGGHGIENSVSEMLTIDRTNQRLYVTNQGSFTVSAHAINPTTGALTPLPFSPINLGNGNWITLAVHPSGSPLVVGDGTSGPANGRLASYQITPTTALAADGSPYNTGSAFPFSSVFSRDGNFVYTGGNDTTTIAGFSVNAATGGLTALAGSPFDSGGSIPAESYATDTEGRLFVGQANRVRVFTTASGIPSAVSGNPFTSGLMATVYGLLHPNGFYLVADRSGNRVGVYQINGNGNATTLAAVTGSPFASGGSFTQVLALNQTGTFLFAANGGSRNLTTFSVDPTTGVLTALSTQPANTLGSAGRLTGMAYLSTACPAITLSPATLPNGTVNTAYNQTITASPAGTYNFTVTTGALPAGLSLQATTGALTGTPTTAGTAIFTITATGAGNCTGSQMYTLTIVPDTSCSYALTPTTQSFDSAGGTGAVTITTGDRCVWVATPDVDWIEITTSKSGVGSDSLRYLVARSTTGPRTGHLTIGEQQLTITQTAQPTDVMQFRAVSRGAKAEEFPSQYGVASFYKNGVIFHRKEGGGRGGRGFNVAAINPATGELLQPVQVFDTWLTRDRGEAMREMIKFLNGWPNGTLILIAVADDAGLNLDNSCTFRSSQWTQDGLSALEQLGSKNIRSHCFQYSFAMAAIKGKPDLTQDKVGNGVQVEAVISSAPSTDQVACVNAASYKPNSPLAPDSIVSAFGPDLSNVDAGQSAPPGVPLPTTLNGSTVKIKDSAGIEQLAPLFYVAKTQINFLMPANVTTGNATVTVTNGAGRTSQGTIQIAMVAPGIFSANADGKGPVVGSAIRVRNGVIIGDEPLARYDATLQKFVGVPLDVSRADERVVIQIYGTGIRKRTSLSNVIVTIGGVRVPVDYAGPQPSFAGLDQLNIEVLRSLSGRGEVEIVIVVDGQPANIVTISIK